MNKDILYTARWYAKEIEKSDDLKRSKLLGKELNQFLTEQIEVNAPAIIKEPKGNKVRLALVVGHTSKARGATLHGGGSEYQYNSKVAERALKFARDVAFDEIDVLVVYRDSVGIQGAYDKVIDFDPDAVIELHFNAFNGRVAGTEILYHDDKDLDPKLERDFAKHILQAMYDVFRPGAKPTDKALRGEKEVKTSEERGWYNVSRAIEFPSVLVEPFFGDTASEAKLGREKLDQYAQMLITSTVDFFKHETRV